ncbi:GntR family transcriptional regulator [Glycomyces luteolus]|uniref:GntR family transcriptional regulator n=1 Tax=Glycomyces luteolus TaxID=2670330 RepID=A0A9X3PBZ2_9ACTN|nr:GntR family transcriptional regulator [Glycomyces luteolus]MDA1361291.1 GntR family transcriptional regulator [Glycomyces luteolus]
MTATPATPEKRTLADEAYAKLKARVMRSELVPGAKLSIDGLAKQLAFSHTPIREALARLESEGLLARRPLSGYTVEPLLSAAEFDDLFEIRMMLEPRAAKRAAEGRASGLVAAEAKALTDAARAPGEGADKLEFTEADARFHNAVAELSGSAQLAKAIRRLDAHLHLHRAYIEPESIGETEVEHLAVADAIIAKQPLAAEEAMRRHLERSRIRHRAAFEAARTTEPAPKPKRAKATR